jgi:hypothetical protein
MTQHIEYPKQQISQETASKVSASSNKTKEDVLVASALADTLK